MEYNNEKIPPSSDLSDQPSSPVMGDATLNKALRPNPLAPDPNVPPKNGKSLLLALPSSLRLMIWEYVNGSTSNTYIWSRDIHYDRNSRTRLYCVALHEKHVFDTAHVGLWDAMPLRLVCCQTYQETRDMLLDLANPTFVSDHTIYNRVALEHFAALLETCTDYAFGQIRSVTVQCEFLELWYRASQLMWVEYRESISKIPHAFRQDIPNIVATFLYCTPETTMRFVLPELGKTSPVKRRIEITYWVVVKLRGHASRLPKPANMDIDTMIIGGSSPRQVEIFSGTYEISNSWHLSRINGRTKWKLSYLHLRASLGKQLISGW